MPDRSVKMKRRIFGFQSRVWWPKCTPASSSSRMEATAMTDSFSVSVGLAPAGLGGAPAAKGRHPRPRRFRRVVGLDAGSLAANGEGLARRAPVAVVALETDVVAGARHLLQEGEAAAVDASRPGLVPGTGRAEPEEEDDGAREWRGRLERDADRGAGAGDPQIRLHPQQPIGPISREADLVAGRDPRSHAQAPAAAGGRDRPDRHVT